MEAIIFGSGPSRVLIDKVPPHIFTVSCNLSYPNANLIFAQDEPILEKLEKKDVKGLTTQVIFTPFRLYEKYGGKRIMLIDEDKLWPRSQGLSTGILAIGIILRLGFRKIYLCGFSFDKVGGTIEKLLTVTSKFDRLYCIVEEPLLLEPPTPNFITQKNFYKLTGK